MAFDKIVLVRKAFLVWPVRRCCPLEMQQYVRQHPAPYETPKAIEFIDALPMITTGRVRGRVLRIREAIRITNQGPGRKE